MAKINLTREEAVFRLAKDYPGMISPIFWSAAKDEVIPEELKAWITTHGTSIAEDEFLLDMTRYGLFPELYLVNLLENRCLGNCLGFTTEQNLIFATANDEIMVDCLFAYLKNANGIADSVLAILATLVATERLHVNAYLFCKKRGLENEEMRNIIDRFAPEAIKKQLL